MSAGTAGMNTGKVFHILWQQTWEQVLTKIGELVPKPIKEELTEPQGETAELERQKAEGIRKLGFDPIDTGLDLVEKKPDDQESDN